MNPKDFDKWNDLKKKIQGRIIDFHCSRRDIWWCALGSNIGSEQDGKNDSFDRPVLIIKTFNLDMVRIVPITSRDMDDNDHVPVFYLDRRCSVIISHLRTISTKRLTVKICRLGQPQFTIVMDRIRKNL